MNILKLCSRIPFPPKDGGTIGVWVLLENLAKIGNNVTVLSLNTNKHYVDLERVKNNLVNNINIIDIPINTDIRLKKALNNLLFSKIPYNSERFYSEKYIKKLTELLKNQKFDIIQIESPNMGYCISTIKKYSNAPIVARTANVENEIWRRAAINEKNLIKKIYFNNLARRMQKLELDVLLNSDAFLTVTKKDLEYFLFNLTSKKKYNVKYKIIPTGINKNQIFNSFRQHKNVDFFFIGALDWLPNQEGIKWFLNNVWLKFIDLNKSIEFHIAGRYASNKFINYLNNYRNVIFHGEVDNAVEYMREHTIMVVPLLSGSGMRVKIVEAMANANAIISTYIGAEGIGATHKNNIIIADTPQEFYNSMYECINDIEYVNYLAKNGLNFVAKNFINENIVLELYDFFRKLSC